MMMRVLAGVGVLALACGLAGVGSLALFLKRGVSARAEPWRVETWLATQLRRVAIPTREQERVNPIRSSPEALAAGLAHFADHCAVCHANDGSGQTSFGRGLYPPPPDMRRDATQQLADGELFWIIRNGIRFTGMPGFGTEPAEEDEETWQLVLFIRHLPALGPDELQKMRVLNPVSREELEEQLRIERFLAGEDVPPESRSDAGHEH